MEQDIKKVTDWLNSHLDKTIIVQKREQDDIDQVHFNLSQFEVRQHDEGIDGYLEPSIILKGTGSTMNSDGDLVPLPQDSYDIVTTDMKIIDQDFEELELSTTRAKYNISIE